MMHNSLPQSGQNYLQPPASQAGMAAGGAPLVYQAVTFMTANGPQVAYVPVNGPVNTLGATPANFGVPPPLPPPPPRYLKAKDVNSVGLCACHQGCADAFFCFPCTMSRVSFMVDRRREGWDFIVLGMAFMGGYPQCIPHSHTRWKMQQLFAAHESYWQVVLLSLCCPLCSLAQMHEDLTRKGMYPGGFCSTPYENPLPNVPQVVRGTKVDARTNQTYDVIEDIPVLDQEWEKGFCDCTEDPSSCKDIFFCLQCYMSMVPKQNDVNEFEMSTLMCFILSFCPEWIPHNSVLVRNIYREAFRVNEGQMETNFRAWYAPCCSLSQIHRERVARRLPVPHVCFEPPATAGSNATMS